VLLNNEEKRSVENLVLAIVRTELANRRTLLAYLNTALALFVSGIGMLKLTEDNWLEWLGFALVPVSIVVAIIGVVDYLVLRRSIVAEKARAAAEESDG